MLNILIDGKRAVLKKNISFEYVAENRRFSKSDSYTLEITFPLKGCEENVRIFGDLQRKDFSARNLVFECEIIDKLFHKKGSVVITQFSEIEVKCQFLEGRSGSKLTSPIADTYINEIAFEGPNIAKSEITPLQAWAYTRDCVALPWVNNDTGNLQNKIEYVDGSYQWASDLIGLSWFPYLTAVIKKICDAVGYSYDISEIENNESLRYLLVCNALPQQWYVPNIARALPHWTVEEFFEKLEDFLFGEFEIDHVGKSIKFLSPSKIKESSGVVEIVSDINDFEADVFVKDSECGAMDVANVKFKKSDHKLQKFWDCNSAIERLRKGGMVIEFEKLSDLVEQINNKFWIMENGHRNTNLGKLYYIKEDKKYYCAQCFYEDPETKHRAMGLQSVNDHAERIVSEDEEAKSVEIEFVPARIDFTDFTYNFTLFCAPGSFSESSGNTSSNTSDGTSTGAGNYRGSGYALYEISHDDFNMDKSEYYDRIYLGWWKGEIQFPGKNPFPNIADVLAVAINDIKRYPFSLSLSSEDSPLTLYSRDINTSVRYHIKFISDHLPSPRSIFLIKGKRYACEKLTATFTERGMSSLVKGEFWRIN